MKIKTFLIIMLLVSSSAYADIIDLGTFSLTQNQKNRLHEVSASFLNGIKCDSAKCYANTTRGITSSERSILIADINALPDTPPQFVQDKQDFSTSPFKGVTATQAETYIDNNVTDLASAKEAMKKMAKALIYLINRTDLN